MIEIKKIYATILLCFCCSLSGTSQIIIDGAGYTKKTNFLRGKSDDIAVFFENKGGNLQAKHTSGKISDFVWQKLDVDTKTFNTVFTQNAVQISTLKNLGNGGFMVTAKNDVSVDTFAVWVFIDTFKIAQAVKYSSKCDWLDLEAKFSPEINFMYRIYKFENTRGVALRDSVIYNKITTKWTTSADIFDGLSVDDSWTKWAKTSISNPAPLVDSKYFVELTDVFGKTVKAETPLIPAIAVYPTFSVEYKEKDNWTPTTTYDGDNNNALYRVRFKHNDSKHADKYTWKGFGNMYLEQTRNVVIWNKTTSNLNEEIYPAVPYMNNILDGYPTGKYGFQLIVENTKTGCRDSAQLSYINVSASSFPYESIPNAFTPNGDGKNDIFKFIEGQEPKSMRTVKIQIFDRSGRRVYSYDGSYENWKGWNGKINNTGAECKSGVYYYVISGKGWDDQFYDEKPYRSFLHLFRD